MACQLHFWLKKPMIKHFIKLHCNIYIYISWFKISKTHPRKGHESQTILPGEIYYNILSSSKFEGEGREELRHQTVKVRR